MQRHLSLISTSTPLAGMQRASELFQHTERVLWITQQDLPFNKALAPQSLCLPVSKARTVLGREFYLVVFDAWSGLNVNALAAVTGTIHAGGALVLLTPQLNEWENYPDPDYQGFLPHPWLPSDVPGYFLKRFVTMLANTGNLLIDPAQIPTVPSMYTVKTTAAQQQALATILLAQRPVVLNADRGRGKSAVLGMVAQQLNLQGKRVVLTAPARTTVDSVFRHAEYPVAFYAPDDLLQRCPVVDVLLVDEAAAIPLPMLLEMLKRYPRCVFATTLRGYEGSGRGFVLRFQRTLAALHPGWLDVKLGEPIRWVVGDWLEGFIDSWLMMDGDNAYQKKIPPSLISGGIGRAAALLQYHQVSQSILANSESKLRQIFNLLVNAHYQTRPSDLRQLLDAPHITLHTIEYQQAVVAVALLAKEGNLAPELTTAIHAGKRRPHGHLLAQSLTFHAGIVGAACLSCQRIMRIAVEPQLQRQGIGTLLLSYLRAYAEKQTADYLGVSYALSPELLDFWQEAGFQTVRLGYRKDKASGSRSLMQVCGLSLAGIELVDVASQVFQQGLPELLLKLGDVPAALAVELRQPAAKT